MRLYEYEAKKIFDLMGIPIPEQYGVVHSPAEIEKLEIGFPVMLKSMVLVGGRGKAGGIKKAKDMPEAKSIAKELFDLDIKGYQVKSILIEEAINEDKACYIGATMDPATFNNVVITSPYGGVDIEKVAREKPDAIFKKEIPDNDPQLPNSVAINLASSLNLNGNNHKLADVISKVYEIYQKFDAKICEINPLIITSKK